LQRPVVAGKGGGAIVGADHALSATRFGAVSAQRASAIGTDGDGFGLVDLAFHGALKLRHGLVKCKLIV
jgi:hypothetical protein